MKLMCKVAGHKYRSHGPYITLMSLPPINCWWEKCSRCGDERSIRERGGTRQIEAA